MHKLLIFGVLWCIVVMWWGIVDIPVRILLPIHNSFIVLLFEVGAPVVLLV
jgi:hypothetical protein